MPFFVSRQQYWGVDPDEACVVEIAGGGLDYANADMLCTAFPGEGQEYDDPRDAVTAALEIAKAWKASEPGKKISVASGFTGGFTMPFEPSNGFELVKWANKLYGKMPKCDMCGKLLPEKNWYTDEFRELNFCSERCAEKNQEFIDKQEREDRLAMKLSEFVFALDNTEEPENLPPGAPFVVVIGTIKDWKEEHRLSDCYTDEEREALEPVFEELELEEMQESMFESNRKWANEEELRQALLKHGLTEDPDFEKFIRAGASNLPGA